MKTTQKHLNNIKSVFGGFKNWWSGKKEAQVPEKPTRESKLQKALDETQPVENSRDTREHPAFRVRADGYDDSYGQSGKQSQASAGHSEHWQQYEAKLDDNLGLNNASSK